MEAAGRPPPPGGAHGSGDSRWRAAGGRRPQPLCPCRQGKPTPTAETHRGGRRAIMEAARRAAGEGAGGGAAGNTRAPTAASRAAMERHGCTSSGGPLPTNPLPGCTPPGVHATPPPARHTHPTNAPPSAAGGGSKHAGGERGVGGEEEGETTGGGSRPLAGVGAAAVAHGGGHTRAQQRRSPPPRGAVGEGRPRWRRRRAVSGDAGGTATESHPPRPSTPLSWGVS